MEGKVWGVDVKAILRRRIKEGLSENRIYTWDFKDIREPSAPLSAPPTYITTCAHIPGRTNKWKEPQMAKGLEHLWQLKAAKTAGEQPVGERAIQIKLERCRGQITQGRGPQPKSLDLIPSSMGRLWKTLKNGHDLSYSTSIVPYV